MTNPFDAPDAIFMVLVNDEGRHSLWPSFTAVPPGWEVALPVADRAGCLAYIEERRTDLRTPA
ncbi:MbtH family protein [Streptomyces sp. SL13]|uniref:MbtH family protein n=1 Tax=Streptantibioticus silvisoli TaxID=2705255 RepID=A0AA90KJV3_9ACTN|nr:MbtH family protein [Streptantibioticus silvisoli]MDI5961996.1 MbtH family protein [Streptantibioticus silvisoli]MDI5973844.1 MbtH family protein [Streptantibioticus silvisoli]